MDQRQQDVLAALQQLAASARQRIDSHPHGHLLQGRERLALTASLPLSLDQASLHEAAIQLDESLRDGIDSILAHAAAFRPGRVLCLRCGTAECAHAAPQQARHVFAGYGPSGLPRFTDFAALLLEWRDPRVDQLYGEAPPLLVHQASEAKLTAALLPAFRDREREYRVHGQAIAGWYRIPDLSGRPELLAVTFQIVSTQPRTERRKPQRRFGVNVLGVGPAGETLDQLHGRLRQIPWSVPVRWVHAALLGIERDDQRRRLSDAALKRRLDGLLAALSRRLGRDERSRGRRTQHAEVRHESGDRPTRMALADLARAAAPQLLYDTRRHTLVVLGERGRAHLFSLTGKLVTSVRYPPKTIEHRRESGIWRTAAVAEVEALRGALASFS